MKTNIALFFLAVSLTFSATGQMILGGDITWTCLTSGSNAGNYIFQLTLFNQCDSGALKPINQTIKVHDGPISSISLSFVKEENISLGCYDSSQAVSCGRNGSGAVSMGIYRSAPVALNGIPGGSGWKFTWTALGRPRNTNLSGLNNGYTIRSIMYNYQNQNANTCFDNSPQFIAPPQSKVCVGYPAIINHHAADPDYDKIVQSFAQPLTNSTTWPAPAIAFNSGYLYSSPFPGTSQNASNVPAVVHNPTGDIAFTSHTIDRINHTIKLASYRDNILISEVYRDFLVDLVNCPPTGTIPPLSNNPPTVAFKDSANAPANRSYPFVDTIWAGTPVSLFLTSTDIQFLPGFIGQSNYTEVYSTQLGAGFADPNNGCDRAPCATMDTSSIFFNHATKRYKGQYGVSTSFNWQTDSLHGGPGGRAYNFHFLTYDDWCPVPGISERTYSVVVYEQPSNFIQGTVFEDLNGNGAQDVGESGRPNILVRQLPSHFYFNSDANGAYSLGAYQGNHDVSIRLPKYHTITTPSSGKHSVTASGSNNIYSGHDFGIQIIPNINDFEVDLTSSGFNRPGWIHAYHIYYRNTGTTTLSGSIDLVPDPSLLTFHNSTITPSSTTGNVYSWNLTNIPRNTNGHIAAYFRIDSSATIGDSFAAFVQINPVAGDTFPSNNVDSNLSFVVNSYDPNNKLSEPGNRVYESHIRNKEFIEYTVNFQNTGNAPAIDVRIEDWLVEDLDIESFEFIGSSHPVTYEIRGRKLTWYFNGINLPDSSSDYLGSMGQVKFRIVADSSLPVGHTIYNSVNIYFDLNEAIFAENTTLIVVDPIVDGIVDRNSIEPQEAVSVYPNPSSGLFVVEINNDISEKIQYEFFTISGNVVQRGFIQLEEDGLGKFEVDLSTSPKGIYFMRLSGHQLNSVKKLVLH